MSNYKHAKDLEGQVLTLIEAIVPEVARAEAAKSIFRRLFHEWIEGLEVGTTGSTESITDPCWHTAAHPGMSCRQVNLKDLK